MLGEVRELQAAGGVADHVDVVDWSCAARRRRRRCGRGRPPRRAASRPRPSRFATRPAASSRCVPASVAGVPSAVSHHHADVALASLAAQDRGAQMSGERLRPTSRRTRPLRRRRPRAAGSCGAMSTSVTSLPRRRNACAISQPTGPAPTTIERRDGLAQIEHRLVGEIGRRVDSGKARDRGPRSGGDDEGLRRELPAVDLERIARDELAGAEDDVDAEAAEALGAVVRLDPLDDARRRAPSPARDRDAGQRASAPSGRHDASDGRCART